MFLVREHGGVNVLGYVPGMLSGLNMPGRHAPGLLVDEQVTLPSLGPHLVSLGRLRLHLLTNHVRKT